ncbi:hypothetical protein L873DRAFT_1788521 [Choiromyces venosus 120613-1]|uniref:Uncharacterized protein n=1 Tax=Choiromyces venosus 120613-1 TaxID=1336337 RepID=A0A3N4JW16_9PEZI|nr:hypothetical protein L873DRAFT_1788521 [Choiromyces venosus 120613-1]
MTVEVNGTKTDISERMSRAISVQELPATPVPKHLDESVDPALPALAMDLRDPMGVKRRTLDFIEYNAPTNHRITQIIDYYGDSAADDENLSREIELIRAAARKHPENQELYAASRATYLVDENGKPRPEMREAIDKVLGNQRGRNSLSSSTESSHYSAMSNIIQPLAPKPVQSRDGEQPRNLLRAMDERKELEHRLLNIQRALSERKRAKRKDVVSQHITGELIDALSPTGEGHDRLPLLPKIPAPSAQMPKRALSRRSTFRRSNLGPGGSGSAGARVSTRLSRYSIDYSDYIFDEYGKPSPVAESFYDTAGGGETSPILRSISQRTENHLHYLRRTRSSETVTPSAVAMLTRTDTLGSTPGNRLDRWLLKQEEYFPPEKAAPVSILPSLPGIPRTPTMRRTRSAEFQRGSADSKSINLPLQSPPMRADSTASTASHKDINQIHYPGIKKQKKAKKKDRQAADNDDNSSCVGIPYAAMLKKESTRQPPAANADHTPSLGSYYLAIELPPSRAPSPSPSTGANPTPPRPPPPRPPPPSEVVEIAPSSGQQRAPGYEASVGMI